MFFSRLSADYSSVELPRDVMPGNGQQQLLRLGGTRAQPSIQADKGLNTDASVVVSGLGTQKLWNLANNILQTLGYQWRCSPFRLPTPMPERRALRSMQAAR